MELIQLHFSTAFFLDVSVLERKKSKKIVKHQITILTFCSDFIIVKSL